MMPADLLRAADVATLANVSPSAVSQWIARYPSFPAPWLDRGAGRTRVRLYRAADVATWLADTGRDEYRPIFEPAARDERARRLTAGSAAALAEYRARRRPHGRNARMRDTAAHEPADSVVSIPRHGADVAPATERG